MRRELRRTLKALAWIGVFDGEPDPEFIWTDEAKACRWINTRPGVELAPLAIAQPFTDAEREAVEEAIRAFGEFSGDEIYVTALRGLLERLA